MSYPDFPNNRLIVNGVDITERYGLIMLDTYTLSPPTPKMYFVDIPGDGQIDLTEALTGDVSFENREQTFNMALLYPKNFEKTKTELSNFLHGKRFEYQLTFDPEYTYTGRFKVTEYSKSIEGQLGIIVINITADPWKRKSNSVYKLNCALGKAYSFESGRRPVRPKIQVDRVTTIFFNGLQFDVAPGTYELHNVVFKEGMNDIYFNSYRVRDTYWGDLEEDGEYEITWEEAKAYRWDELAARRALSGTLEVVTSWNDLQNYTWGDISEDGDYEKRWVDLNYTPDNTEAYVYFQYERSDL